MLPVAAADLVSPIFTLWLTLLLMYAANCLADYSAAATLNAAYTADLRRGAAAAGRRLGCRLCQPAGGWGVLLGWDGFALLHALLTAAAPAPPGCPRDGP